MPRQSKWLTKANKREAEEKQHLWPLPTARERMHSWGELAEQARKQMRTGDPRAICLNVYNNSRRQQAKFAYLIELKLAKEEPHASTNVNG